MLMQVEDVVVRVEDGMVPVNKVPMSNAAFGIGSPHACPECQARVLHAGCPLTVFGFNRGRGMCGAYLGSFTE